MEDYEQLVDVICFPIIPFEINPLVVEVYGMEELIGVIKHELCHYHLHIEGKGYRHRDADFKNLLKANVFAKVL